MKRLWRACEILAWLAFFSFAALVLVLRFWVLPDIERYRPDIVAAISRATGLPVKIGAIEAGWLGLRPQISLSDVRLYDAQGREALVLPAVDNVVAWRSLLAGRLRLHSLVIDGPRLTVRRDAAGALYVAGLKLAASEGEGESGFTDWMLAQDEIVVRSAEIEWRDEKRGAPPLALTALNFRLRSSGDSHAFGLRAQPPAALAASFELRAELDGRSLTQPAAWSGRLFAEFGATDLAAWRPWLDYPLDLREGRGALRVWATLENGRLREATADVALAQVFVQLAPELAPLELAAVQGRVQGRVLEGGYEIGARRLAVIPAQGPAVQPTDFQVSWQKDPAQGGTLTAGLIEFEPLANLSASLPLPERLRQRIRDYEPRGRLLDVKLDWQGEIEAPQRFNARARFADLSLRPWEAAPGFAGLSGSVEGSERKGRLSLASRNAAIELPRLFPEPRIPLESLSGQLDWERQGERGLTLAFSSVSFANRDASGTAYGSYTWTGEGPGSIDLAANVTRADGSRIGAYLPRGEIMGEKTRAWLVAAIAAGQASDAHLRLRGDLRDFPFVDSTKGQFLVSARVQDGVLNYAEGWPGIAGIEADLLFSRDDMVIVGRRGHIFGARLANVRVTLDKMLQPDVHLQIAGQAEGPTSDFLRFVAASPVRDMTHGATEGLRATGGGTLHLKIDLPLDAPDKTRVAGEYQFAANSVHVIDQLPPIERAGGRVAFSDEGFALRDVRGRLNNGPITVSGGTKRGAGTEIVARGEMNVTDTRALFDHPWREYLSGGAPYLVTITTRDGTTRYRLESSLRGVASALPPPLDKAAVDALPLRVEVIPSDNGSSDRISLTLGRLLAAEILRRRQGESMAVQRASVAFSPEPGRDLRLPQRPGTLVYGSLARLDADRWLALAAPGGAGFDAGAVDLRIGVLDVFGKRLNGVAINAGADAVSWTATVKAEEASGEVSYRAAAGGQIVARLDYLAIPKDTPGEGGTRARSRSLRPSDLPSIDLTAERFSLKGNELGRLEFAASRAGDDWRIDKLSLAGNDSSLTASGGWKAGATTRSTLDFEIDTADAGAFLEQLGYAGLVKGGKANLKGSLAWQGEPMTIDFPTLDGQLKLSADDGQFVELEPGIGKLISLMSLQALPRRISLDFRDVFSKGFQFDHIGAEAKLDDGVMAIKEFRMRSSAAEVQMSGDLDLARETQNLRVRVIPGIGDSASTALVLVNPAVGVAAAIAQRVLKNPLGQIFSFDYSVTGNWSDPKVAKVLKPGAENVIPQ